jgi:AmmeMemoRadiSam system protein B/AmmeMemoRadiSam system protein A
LILLSGLPTFEYWSVKGKVMKIRSEIKILSWIIALLWLSAVSAVAQTKTDRQPYAAGKFYEADAGKLKNDLAYLFEKARGNLTGNILAVISPHAGYVYSGEVAATAFKQLNPDKTYEHIFLIGSSHTMFLNGASVYDRGNYITPLGTVKVDTELAHKLINDNKYISFVEQAHTQEHSLENQLPFLQYYLKKPFRIVPVIIGTDDPEILQSIAETLRPYLNDKNLFVISSDFSHYPRYRDAQKADSLTAKGILSNNPETFLKALKTNENKHYPGLVTSACGHSSILTLLYMTEDMHDVSYVPLKYMNSGDVSFGDKNRVVGYFALALTQKADNPEDFLTNDDKEKLLQIARQTIELYLSKYKIPEINENTLSDNLKVHSGAFVTLNKNGSLRGCIGRFIADESLYKVVQQMAIAAATQDYRFPTVEPKELENIDIEISVLTPLKRINSIDEIQLGRDGIYIKKGNRSGTFLPQVAEETGWSLTEFLGHCARDKAGIGWDGSKDADIYTYRAIVFSEDKF